MGLDRQLSVDSEHVSYYCNGCETSFGSAQTITWSMSKLDVEFGDESDLRQFAEKGANLPLVVFLPDDGGGVVYLISSYCDDCFNAALAEYEEQNTPPGKIKSGDFETYISHAAHDRDWTVYALRLSRLVPRGLPNMVLLRGEDLLFPRVEGDVSVRLRSRPDHNFPASKVMISPAVPKVALDKLNISTGHAIVPDTIAFLYMDEKYLDASADSKAQVTSLAGLLVPANVYPLFRNRLFQLLPSFEEGHKAFDLEIHASNLFRGLPDEAHFDFYRGLVGLVNDMSCRVYRRGFNFVPSNDVLRRNQQDLLFRCFRSMLISIDDAQEAAQIWPVMEIDHTSAQEVNFGGYMRWMNHATAYLETTGDGVEELIDDDHMVDTNKFGDLHYVSKQSIVGNAVDCMVYLLHCRWLNDNDLPLTEYKRNLAEIASDLQPSLVDDYIARFCIAQP